MAVISIGKAASLKPGSFGKAGPKFGQKGGIWCSLFVWGAEV